MKKKIFSDNNIKKSSKGFYAALGISAVMIGSACYFAYDQNQKLSDKPSAENIISVPEKKVDKKADGIPKSVSIPKQTTIYYTTVPRITTTRTVTTQIITIPSSEVIVAVPHEEEVPAAAENETPQVQADASKLENAKLPLSNIDNVLEDFSGTELVKSQTTGSWQTHNGTDFAAEVGSEVYAVSSGEVTKIDKDALWGVTVTVDHHNGFVSKYCSLGEQLSVQEGDIVASGQLLGSVGQTADIESSSEPHLHLEISHNGSYINPLSVF